MVVKPLIAFYGDDFTGSTDALECLAAAGLRAVLFTDIPSAEQLARYEGLQAVGIAGNTRSLTPDEMEDVLPAAYAALTASGAPILHYKVCSTFDSSATIGSFGRAIDIARREIGTSTIPIVVGAPRLGRFSYFGTLFARDNVDGAIHRIDRHPTMSRHPTTPMREGDMRLHIGAQTDQAIALFPAPAIAGPDVHAKFDDALKSSPDALMIDIADEPAEARVGELLARMARGAAPLFVLGSSGVEYALIAHWRRDGRLPAEVAMAAPGAVDRLLVVSGSCSPVTGGQIAAAQTDGFADIALDPVALVREGEHGAHARAAVAEAIALLEAGRSIVAHTSTGREDPREAALVDHLAGQGVSAEDARLRGGRALAAAAGRFLRDVLARVPLQRFVVAGGDTSTAAMRMLGVEALEMIAPLSPGAPLCRILAPGHRLDGREIVLKGGQMGTPRFFSQVKAGHV